MKKYLEPRIEIAALFSLSQTNIKTLSDRTGIPQYRIENALGGGILSINEFFACKKSLKEIIAENARRQPSRAGGE